MPLWVAKIYAWWKMRPVDGEPFAERFYDPVPTVRQLSIPSLWIFAAQDSSMPTQWSLDKLEPLRAQGKPIYTVVYPDTEHGILTFDKNDPKRTLRGYPASYLKTQIQWLRYRSGLESQFQHPLSTPPKKEEPASSSP